MIRIGNKRKYRAGVQGLLEPVKSRFTYVVSISPTLEGWMSWCLTTKHSKTKSKRKVSHGKR